MERIADHQDAVDGVFDEHPPNSQRCKCKKLCLFIEQFFSEFDDFVRHLKTPKTSAIVPTLKSRRMKMSSVSEELT
jgi:hypothetical protein